MTDAEKRKLVQLIMTKLLLIFAGLTTFAAVALLSINWESKKHTLAENWIVHCLCKASIFI